MVILVWWEKLSFREQNDIFFAYMHVYYYIGKYQTNKNNESQSILVPLEKLVI